MTFHENGVYGCSGLPAVLGIQQDHTGRNFQFGSTWSGTGFVFDLSDTDLTVKADASLDDDVFTGDRTATVCRGSNPDGSNRGSAQAVDPCVIEGKLKVEVVIREDEPSPLALTCGDATRTPLNADPVYPLRILQVSGVKLVRVVPEVCWPISGYRVNLDTSGETQGSQFPFRGMACVAGRNNPRDTVSADPFAGFAFHVDTNGVVFPLTLGKVDADCESEEITFAGQQRKMQAYGRYDTGLAIQGAGSSRVCKLRRPDGSYYVEGDNIYTNEGNHFCLYTEGANSGLRPQDPNQFQLYLTGLGDLEDAGVWIAEGPPDGVLTPFYIERKGVCASIGAGIRDGLHSDGKPFGNCVWRAKGLRLRGTSPDDNVVSKDTVLATLGFDKNRSMSTAFNERRASHSSVKIVVADDDATTHYLRHRNGRWILEPAGRSRPMRAGSRSWRRRPVAPGRTTDRVVTILRTPESMMVSLVAESAICGFRAATTAMAPVRSSIRSRRNTRRFRWMSGRGTPAIAARARPR